MKCMLEKMINSSHTRTFLLYRFQFSWTKSSLTGTFSHTGYRTIEALWWPCTTQQKHLWPARSHKLRQTHSDNGNSSPNTEENIRSASTTSEWGRGISWKQCKCCDVCQNDPLRKLLAHLPQDNLPPIFKNELIIERDSSLQLRPSLESLRREAQDLDVQIRQLQVRILMMASDYN